MSTPSVCIIIDTTYLGGPGKGLMQFLNHASPEFRYKLCVFGYLKQVQTEFIELAREKNLNIEIINQKSLLHFSGPLKQLRKIIRDNDINIIQSHNYKSHFFAFLVSLSCDIPWVAFAHGWTYEDRKVRLYNLIDKTLLRFAQHSITVSPAMYKTIRRLRGAEPVSLIGNAVDPEELRSKGNSPEIRQRYAPNPDSYLIGCFGRLSHEKGQDILIRAFAEALKINNRLSLMITGDGPDKDKLKSLAEELGCQSNIHFTGYQSQIKDYIEAVDLVALPSRSEGMPNIILEALALETPAIATRVGAVPELIQDGNNGFLVDSEDFLDLGEKIGKLSNEELSLKKDFSLPEKFSPDFRARRILEVYTNVLSVKRRPLWKRVTRWIFYNFYSLIWARGRRQLRQIIGKQEVVVLAYHHVSEIAPAPVNVTTGQFEKQMAWLEKNFTLIKIEDLVRGKLPERSKKPFIAITFDDALHDNYLNALPVLIRHRVPAAFFIPTSLIPSEPAGKRTHMIWKEIKDLQTLGFLSGGHTATHIDCGKNPAEVVRREMQISYHKIKEELNIDAPPFACPYGSRVNITEDTIHISQETGFSCCMTAYGGINISPVDPFHITRSAVDQDFSFAAFKARALGYQLHSEKGLSPANPADKKH